MYSIRETQADFGKTLYGFPHNYANTSILCYNVHVPKVQNRGDDTP